MAASHRRSDLPPRLRGVRREAIAAGEGPFLDAGCGTATFTAAAYRGASRPLVLVDRSLDMLGRTAEHFADTPVALVQADLLDLPFFPRRFATVACFRVLHVLHDPWAALAALGDQAVPGGQIFASMLVADRRLGRPGRLRRLGRCPAHRVDGLATRDRARNASLALSR